ncbi:MAG: hypothetical protein MN733_33505, partial [Nitrososphaera sp.]|nr:hypothetical protein [Nitrososphaera sp.]
GMSRAEIARKFDEIVAFAEVETFLDTPVKRYSSGMAVRLAFAVAAHLEPEILLVDEVLAVGDTDFQRKCVGAMRGLADRHRTVLFVSHNMNAIRNLCSRAILLQDGTIKCQGNPDEVITNYIKGQDLSSISKTGHLELENGYKYLRKIVVIAESGEKESSIPYESSFATCVTFDAPSKPQSFILALRVIDELGNVILTSWDNDAIQKQRMVTGARYLERCLVPGRLLRPGRYILQVFLRSYAHYQVVEEESADFLIEISNLGFIQGSGRWGLIAPILHWEVEEDVT